MASLTERLRSIDSLPPLPTTLIRLIDALNAGEVSSEELERDVLVDRGLSMAVIRVANSAQFGASQAVTSIQDAITRVGHKELYRIALAHQGRTLYQDRGEGYGLVGDQAWQGSVAGAIAAELLAGWTGLCDPPITFTAALLRDCGKLAMDQLLGAETMQTAFGEEEGNREHVSYERRVFGFDHCEVGGDLARLWGLPERLELAIRHHHCPPAETTDPLFDLVHCADCTCVMMGFGVGHDGLAYEMNEEARARIGFDLGELERLMMEVSERMKRIEQDFGGE